MKIASRMALPGQPGLPAQLSTRARLDVGLQGLRLGAIWRAILSQSPAVWMVQAYLFFEYVRPQTIYPSLDVAPWSQITILSAAALTLLEGRLKFTATGLWGAILGFTLVIFASIATAQYPGFASDNINLWVNWLLLMLIVGAGLRTRRELLLVVLGFCLWNLKMSQHGVKGWASIGFSFRAIGIGGAPGWFQNSGEFGIEMCVFMPIVAYLAYGLWPSLSKAKRWALVAITLSALISIVASSSRGAMVGAAALGLWALMRSPNRGKVLLIGAVLAAFTWAVTPQEVKERFSQSGEDQSSVNRLTYWKHGIEIANRYPVLGIGYKNWLPYYRANYNPRGEVPHNYLVEAGSELGYLGLGALLVVFASYFVTTAGVRKRTSASAPHPDRLLWSMALGLDGAMLGFLVSGFFVTVLYYPYIWMNVALAMALSRVAASAPRSASTTGPVSRLS